MLTLQYILNGVMTGSMYGLIGLAIVVIYKSTKVFNFAVGSLLTIGGLLCLTMITRLHLSLWIALPLALVLSGIIGALVERLALRPLLAQPILTLIMATLFIDSILQGSIFMLWTTYTHSFPLDIIPGETILIGPLFISPESFYAFIMAFICFALVGYFFKKTHTGLKMRTTAENQEVAMALGVNVNTIFGLTWILAVVVGTLAGVLLGNQIGLQANMTPAIAFRAVPGVILGGLDSMAGAIFGGIIVGVMEQLAGGVLGSEYAEVTPYFILLLVLFIRPEGLFGMKRIERI